MSERELHQIVSDKRTESIVQSHRVRRAGSRRQSLIALFVLVVIAGVLAAAYFLFSPRSEVFTLSSYDSAVVTVQTLQDTVEVGGSVAARTTATVTAPEKSFVRQLLVSEGDWVTRGQLLVRLDADELESQRASLGRSLQQKLREYDRFLLEHEYKLRRLGREAEILAAERLDAEENLTETRELRTIGSATATDLRNAERAVADARTAIADHEASVEEELALHGLTRQNYEVDIEVTREEIADIDRRLAETAVRAPISGRVTAIATTATVTGTLLSQYETILDLADTRNPVVRTGIEEQYVPLIEVGDPVSVEIAGTRLVGVIERIGQIATTGSDGGTPTVELSVALGTETGEVLPGSSALITVLVGQIDDALVLPRGPFLTSGNRRYLYRITGGEAERIGVTFGKVTTDRVQVVSGVRPGDRIITSSYQTYLDQTGISVGGIE